MSNTNILEEMQKEMLKMAAEWSIMKNEWADMKSQQSNQGTKLDRILAILENDDATGQKGIVYDVHLNNQFRETMMTKIKFVVLIGSAVISTVVAILTKNFIK